MPCGWRRADAQVVLVARTVEKLDSTLAEIAAAGGTARAYACDVADLAACDRLVRDVSADLGGADILINNAGRSIRRSVRYSYDRFSRLSSAPCSSTILAR